jgi:hypothetical protein
MTSKTRTATAAEPDASVAVSRRRIPHYESTIKSFVRLRFLRTAQFAGLCPYTFQDVCKYRR